MTTKQKNIITIPCYYCHNPLQVDEDVIMAVCKKCFGKLIKGMAGEVMKE